MNFNEARAKAVKLDKQLNQHDRANIKVRNKNYFDNNPVLQEAKAEQENIANGAKVVDAFLGFYLNYQEGGAVSPKIVYNVLKSSAIIAVGRSLEENKQAVFTLLDDIYFNTEERNQEFKQWAETLWEKMTPTLLTFENYGAQDFLNYIKAHTDYMKEQENKQRKKKK